MIISWLFHCIFWMISTISSPFLDPQGWPLSGPRLLRTPTPWRPSLIHAASIFTRSYRVRKLERVITEKMTMMWLFLIILDEFWMLGMDIGWILGGHGMCGGFLKDLKGSKKEADVWKLAMACFDTWTHWGALGPTIFVFSPEEINLQNIILDRMKMYVNMHTWKNISTQVVGILRWAMGLVKWLESSLLSIL